MFTRLHNRSRFNLQCYLPAFVISFQISQHIVQKRYLKRTSAQDAWHGLLAVQCSMCCCYGCYFTSQITLITTRREGSFGPLPARPCGVRVCWKGPGPVRAQSPSRDGRPLLPAPLPLPRGGGGSEAEGCEGTSISTYSTDVAQMFIPVSHGAQSNGGQRAVMK